MTITPPEVPPSSAGVVLTDNPAIVNPHPIHVAVVESVSTESQGGGGAFHVRRTRV